MLKIVVNILLAVLNVLPDSPFQNALSENFLEPIAEIASSWKNLPICYHNRPKSRGIIPHSGPIVPQTAPSVKESAVTGNVIYTKHRTLSSGPLIAGARRSPEGGRPSGDGIIGTPGRRRPAAPGGGRGRSPESAPAGTGRWPFPAAGDSGRGSGPAPSRRPEEHFLPG